MRTAALGVSTTAGLLAGLLWAGCWPSSPPTTTEPAVEAAPSHDSEAPGTPVVGAPAPAPAPFTMPPIDARPDGRLIDVHTHVFGVGVWDDIASVMQDNGVDYFVNLSGGSPRDGASMGIDLAHQSSGRVINLMNVDWEGIDELTFGETVAAELDLLVRRHGYAGLKISKALGLGVRDALGALIPVDDARLFPIWEKARELGVPVFIHTADPAAFWLPVTPDNERFAELSVHPSWSFAGPEYPERLVLLAQLENVFRQFPHTTFVSVHMGNNAEDLDEVARLLRAYPNVLVDIAARVPEFGRHPAPAVRAFFVEFQDRILFGTDIQIGRRRSGVHFTLGSGGAEPDTRDEVAPFYAAHRRYLETNDPAIAHPTPIQGDWTVDAIGLPTEVLDKVYYLNAYRLLLQAR